MKNTSYKFLSSRKSDFKPCQTFLSFRNACNKYNIIKS